MNNYIPAPLLILSEQFAKLPGIGIKTAQRLAYHVLNMPAEEVKTFSESMVSARSDVCLCSVCQNFSEEARCSVCADLSRDKSVICVVEFPKDVFAFERGRVFKGVYHVLHGTLSPMDNIGPDDIRIRELMSRLGSSDVREVILATNPTIDGEATAAYLNRMMRVFEGVLVSRLAYGLPVGANLEYADDVTLAKAIENRNRFV